MTHLLGDQKTLASGDVSPTPHADTPTFLPGSVVAGRYLIACFIARGGMGEVYAAEDLSLHEPVALKTIRPELAALPGALPSFKRELRLARRVTHPNICRVFDLGEHPLAATGTDAPSKIFFLTMELLEGRTLHEYLVNRGRLSPRQVLPLAEQMAAALDALHAEEIVHRDFKTGNVMLVPSAAVPGGLRVVVTDFGLAHGEVLGGEGMASPEGHLVGSPAYMSPEQVEGQPLTPASDLYSFGVVLYELLTGQRPFVADTPTATALLRLQKPAIPPREWVPELPPAWERMLMRCLERRPEDRFSSVSEAVASLRGGTTGSTAALTSPPWTLEEGPPRAGRASPAEFSQELTRVVSASMPRLPRVEQPLARPVMAVLAPRNLMGGSGPAWLSTALAELLCAELAVGEQLRLLSGEDVARMRGDLALAEQDGFAADTLQRMRVHSGVDWVLTGSYVMQGQGEGALLRLNLRLQEAASGETRTHLKEVGAEQQLLELVSRMGGTLRTRLGLDSLTPEQAQQVRSTLPSTPEAARLYAEGLVALRGHDAATAIEHFERVVQQDATFAPAHSALAAAFQGLYQDEAAKQSARRAFELAEGLSREERLLVSARHHEAQAEWPQAIEAYRTLSGSFPDHVEYGIALMYAQLSAGQNREAQATLESLRRLPAPPGQEARIHLAAAVFTSSTADFLSSRRHAETAVEQARRAGQGQLAASALVMGAYALRNLGEPLQAAVLLEESERLFLAGGDRGGATRSMLVHAVVLIDTGRLKEAERVLVSALEAARALRGVSLQAEVLTHAGSLSCHLGDLAGALRYARESVELYRQRGRLAEMNASTIMVGKARRLRGELDEARRQLEQGCHAAQVLFEDDYIEAWARYELGCVHLELDGLRTARQQLERSLELRRKRGLGAFVAETELALARLALEEGRPREALASVDSALATHATLHQPEREGLACAMKARVLRALGDIPGARQALERARTLAAQTEDVFILAELELTGAHLIASRGSVPEREQVAVQLQGLARRAARGGLRGVELEARLLRVELDLQTKGAPVPGELTSIRRTANRLGFRGLLRRSHSL